MKKKGNKVRVGISIGDPNGIGMEIILKTLEDQRICELCTPIVYSPKNIIDFNAKSLGLNNLSLNYFSSIDELKGNKANCIDLGKSEFRIKFGEESAQSGKMALLSLDTAMTDLKAQKIDCLVAAPIHKKAMQLGGFKYPGHTEYLQHADQADDSLMLMISREAKIGVVTSHIPLKDVASTINSELILKKISLLNQSLKTDFGIQKPKIAVLGLNPHAGEDGVIGKEESEIIVPAIKQAKSIEILAFGPYPADGFFASSKHREVDGVLAMYHDQGLIPSKLFAASKGVNFTSGLSFVRTSPDHGTAFEIAGKGIANESAFRSALYQAIDIAKQRALKEELEENVLPINKTRNKSA